jgi:hypothetical protein
MNRLLSEDDLDEYEYSEDDAKQKSAQRNQTTFANKPYDEAYEISQDLSVAESFEAKDKVEPDNHAIFIHDLIKCSHIDSTLDPKS